MKSDESVTPEQFHVINKVWDRQTGIKMDVFNEVHQERPFVPPCRITTVYQLYIVIAYGPPIHEGIQ